MLQYAHLQDERPQIANLVATATDVKWDVQESELQALLVEAALIKNYQPPFNILLKDDKSSLYIALTHEEFPRVITMRKPELVRLKESVTSFGPYQSGYKVKQVLEIARNIFKWCERPISREAAQEKKVRSCFYSHIGLCSGACTGLVAKEEYKEIIAHLREFLHGKTSVLLKELKAALAQCSEKHEFEKAARLRDQITAIVHVTSKEYRLKPDMTLPVLTGNMQQEALVSLRSILSTYFPLPRTAKMERIEGYDISNIQGTNPTASMVVAINGKMDHKEYKHFGIKTLSTPNDFAMMKETLIRRQLHPEWGLPDVVLIDGGKGQLRTVLSIWKWPGIVVSIAKDPDRLLIPLPSVPSTKKAKPGITYKEVLLTQDVPATRLLQSIRDESHRFSRRLHHIKRDKSMFA